MPLRPDNILYRDFDAMNLDLPPERIERLKKLNRLVNPKKTSDQKYYGAPPFDPRFPNTNQALNCYQNYMDYHRCQKKKPGWEACDWYKNAYESLCPIDWYKKWDMQRKKGIFPGDTELIH
ncbi:cytochrome c oxidase subunit 6B [Brevipalpus obovatus]|uniref:cytochrome c oxidase subunit 6B n=1 Tax=Brevipalpus obovatus TaxID=246614 RepID=UPI003D9F1C03